MKPTRQIFADNPRMAWALVGSALIHAVLISAISFKHSPKRRVEAGGFHATLIARIAGAQKTNEPVNRAAMAKPSVERRAPEQPDPSRITLAVPGPEADVADAEFTVPPEAAPEGGGGTGVHPGVSIAETLFQRPLPPEFQKLRVENYPDFIRSTEADQPPQPDSLAMPDYPAKELAAKKYNWIVIAFFVDEQGQVVDAVPVTGGERFEDFQDQVVAAVRDSTFTPALRAGVPVKSITFQRFEFRPEEDAAPVTQPRAPAVSGK